MNAPITAWATTHHGAPAGRPVAPQATTPAPAPTGRPPIVEGSTGSTARPATPCVVCGVPLDPGTGRVPRSKHPRCLDVTRFSDAAWRALSDVIEAGITPEASQRLRSEWLARLNKLPITRHAARGRGGRFIKGGAK